MPLYFEKPLGTKDLLPTRVQQGYQVIKEAQKFIQTWGYEEVKTPIIEYFETIGVYSQIPTERLIKFQNALGQTIILRPDLTIPLARFAALTYGEKQLPIRLSCVGEVYRVDEQRSLEQIKQLDVELIGLEQVEGDGEIIALAVQLILGFGLRDIKITIGHTQFLKVLLKELGCSPEEVGRLFNYLLRRDYVGFRQLAKDLQIKELSKVLMLKGSLPEVLVAQNWFNTPEWRAIFKELEELDRVLEEYGVADYVNYDLTLVGNQNYYSGLIFNIYCAGHPYPLCTGGRYDNLLAAFKRPAAAVGCALNLGAVVEVIDWSQQPLSSRKSIIIYEKNKRSVAIEKALCARQSGREIVLAEKGEVNDEYLKDFKEIIFLG